MGEQSPRVFVCYRRDDSRWQANLLADELAARFGDEAVFMDVDNVRPGDWRRQVDASLADCAAVVVVIGPDWLAEFSKRAAGDDQVRYEITQALQRGKVVVPVTVDHAQLPDRASLPEEIADLSNAQGYELGVDVMWRPTVGKLVDDLSDFLDGRPGPDFRRNSSLPNEGLPNEVSGDSSTSNAVLGARAPDRVVTSPTMFRRPLFIGMAVLTILLIALGAWKLFKPNPPIPPKSTSPAQQEPKPVASGTVTGTCDEGGSCGVRLRTAPHNDAPTFIPGKVLNDGETIQIVCQTIGDRRTNAGQVSTDYWYQLNSGAYISAVYVTIEASGRIPECSS